MAETPRPEEIEGQTQADSKDIRPVYEVGFHLVPTIGEEGVPKMVEKIRKALGDAEIIAEGAAQKMTLAYVIERSVSGKREKYAETYFGWIKFAVEERAAVEALAEKLRGMSEVLRYLLVETVREDISQAPARAVFTSDRLEGQTLQKIPREAQMHGEVSEEELEKSIEALVAPAEEKGVN